MTQVDDLDRHMLRLLAHDGRMSITALSAALGVTRVTVQSRMDRLRSEGIIRRFTIEADFVGQDQTIQAISTIELRPQKSEPIQRALKRMPAIIELHTTNGKWGLVARTETRNLADFDETLTAIGLLDGVVAVETCLLLTRII